MKNTKPHYETMGYEKNESPEQEYKAQEAMAYVPVPPTIPNADDQPDHCGIDGWCPSDDPCEGREPSMGMGCCQIGDQPPVCPDCDEEDEGA